MQNNKLKVTINEDNANIRIDIALSNLTKHSRSMIQKLIYSKNILLNNQIIEKANKLTKINEKYFITEIKTNFTEITTEEYCLNVLYEDEEIIVINKPPELIVHPGAGNPNNTLINKLAYHCSLSNIAGPEKLGTVHRLDKGVSGCIIFAKNNESHINLSSQFANRIVKKQYLALCHNIPNPLEQYIENYISRSNIHRQKMMINKNSNGKLAQMNIKTLKIINQNNSKYSLIECNPITGRMHQIRVQLSNIGSPIINDPLYGIKESKEIKELFKNRIALHAFSIIFNHPKTNKEVRIQSNIPKEFNI